MRTLTSTPRNDGFRMPAEFELHSGSWMLWPERTDIWPHGAKPAQQTFTGIATAVAGFEPVTVGVSRSQYQNARLRLPSHIRVVEMSYNGCWIRDTGPTFVVSSKGEVRGVHWRFNAWGGIDEGLYFPWDQDALVPSKILDMERLDRYEASLVLEGGAIHVDGNGTLMAVKECVLNPNRNPDWTQCRIEACLRDYLNVDHFIWLEKGLYLDETGGHIDNICAFVRPGVVVLAWTDDKSDPQYERSMEAFETLSRSRDANGRQLEIHKVLQPNPIYITREDSEGIDKVPGTVPREPGSRLPASYVNFYIVNGGVVVPQFGDTHDELAREQIARLFPDRRVIGVPTRAILFGGGNIHCNIQQQPRGVLSI